MTISLYWETNKMALGGHLTYTLYLVSLLHSSYLRKDISAIVYDFSIHSLYANTHLEKRKDLNWTWDVCTRHPDVGHDDMINKNPYVNSIHSIDDFESQSKNSAPGSSGTQYRESARTLSTSSSKLLFEPTAMTPSSSRSLMRAVVQVRQPLPAPLYL